MQGNSRHGSSRAPSRAPSRGAADAERIVGLLEPAVAALGMDLEGVKITSAGRRRLLRIVVDADGGVSLDDMALASRELSATLALPDRWARAAHFKNLSLTGAIRNVFLWTPFTGGDPEVTASEGVNSRRGAICRLNRTPLN